MLVLLKEFKENSLILTIGLDGCISFATLFTANCILVWSKTRAPVLTFQQTFNQRWWGARGIAWVGLGWWKEGVATAFPFPSCFHMQKILDFMPLLLLGLFIISLMMFAVNLLPLRHSLCHFLCLFGISPPLLSPIFSPHSLGFP